MSRRLETQVTQSASTAKNLLGQLGPLVWALHCHHGAVAPTAILLSVDPDGFLGAPSEEIRKRAIDDIRALRQGIVSDDAPVLFTSEGLRATINRSIVVYAVAVLEHFLDEAGHPVYRAKDGREAGWKLSFSPKCKALSCVGISLYRCDHYAEAALLDLYRHKIVHVEATVDKKLPGQLVSIGKEAGRELGFRLSCDESSVVWVPCGGQELCSSWIGKRLSLAIDEVILPLLRDSQAFVKEAEGVLLEHARNCPPASASPE